MSFSSDFVRVYDRFNDGADYAQKEDLILSHLPDGARHGLDLGCGTGELSIRLSGRFDMTAVDLSEEMLAFAAAKAEKQNAKVRFLKQDIRFLKLNEQFDFAVCLQDTLNYLLSDADLARALKQIAEHLKEDACFFYDLSTKKRFEEAYQNQTCFLSRRGAKMVWESAYHQSKKECDFRFTLFLKEADGKYRMSIEEETQRFFDPGKVSDMLEASGFTKPCLLLDVPEERQIFMCAKKG